MHSVMLTQSRQGAKEKARKIQVVRIHCALASLREPFIPSHTHAWYSN
jgi:hypothetical protein